MDELRKQLCADQQIPDRVGIYAVRQRSPEEHARRLKQLLTIVGEARECKDERGDWLHQEDRITVRLPRGGRAEVYHGSGAMRVISGLPPMEQLFEKEFSREELQKLVVKVAQRIGVKDWVAKHENLAFERFGKSRRRPRTARANPSNQCSAARSAPFVNRSEVCQFSAARLLNQGRRQRRNRHGCHAIPRD